MSATRTRLVLLAIIGGITAALLVGCGGSSNAGGSGGATTSPSSASGKSTGGLQEVVFATRPITDMVPAHLCIDKGICRKHGISLEIKDINGTSADIAAALQSGAADIAYVGTTNVLQARQQGFDQVIIASAAAESRQNPSGDANALVFRDSAVKTGSDLEGQPVAVKGLESASQALVMAWVAKTGGDPNAVKFVDLADPQKPDAVQSGRVLAAHVPEPYRSVALGKNLHAIDIALQTRPRGLVIGAIAAKQSAVAANPTLYKNLVRALEESSELANHDQSLAKATLKSFSPLDPGLVDESNLPFFTTKVELGNVKFWEDAVNKYFDAGLTVPPTAAISKVAPR